MFDSPIANLTFLAYVEQVLVQTLRAGDVIVLDKARKASAMDTRLRRDSDDGAAVEPATGLAGVAIYGSSFTMWCDVHALVFDVVLVQPLLDRACSPIRERQVVGIGPKRIGVALNCDVRIRPLLEIVTGALERLRAHRCDLVFVECEQDFNQDGRWRRRLGFDRRR